VLKGLSGAFNREKAAPQPFPGAFLFKNPKSVRHKEEDEEVVVAVVHTICIKHPLFWGCFGFAGESRRGEAKPRGSSGGGRSYLLTNFVAWASTGERAEESHSLYAHVCTEE